MHSEYAPENPGSVQLVEVVASDDVLTFGDSSRPLSLFLDPRLNHTPVQCAMLMKMRPSGGRSLALAESSGKLRAELVYPDDECARINVFDGDGDPLWSDTIRVEECLPDSPRYVIPTIRPMYRTLAGTFMLFLLVLVPIMLIYPYAGARFATLASLAVLLVVVASVGLLILVRTWLKL